MKISQRRIEEEEKSERRRKREIEMVEKRERKAYPNPNPNPNSTCWHAKATPRCCATDKREQAGALTRHTSAL